MSDQFDRSRYHTVTSESVAAAGDAAKRYMGGPFRLEKGNRYYLRFMPAFKVNAASVPQWWSYGMRHYSVPIIGAEQGKKVTMDCPQTIGARCIPCEYKKVFQQMGAWDDFKGCSPRKRVYFNVIDIQNLDAGVQVLEDGPKLWSLLREEFEEENDQLFDPFTGSVLIVIAKDADPWRKLKYPTAHQCSLDEIHPDALTWALPENLNELDEQWEYPSLEEQMETFSFLVGARPGQIAAPSPKAQIESPAPAAAPVTPAAAPVTPGVAAILEEEVIEGEVLEEESAPAPAQAPAPQPVAAPAPAVTPAAILEEAQAAVSAPAPAGTAAILAEAEAAASPVPDDAAPTPAAATAPVAAGGSQVLQEYQEGMDGETEIPD